ncbi:MAG: sodium-translocating pyrophosphatase [Pirellulales bacterium]|nr:sodium-translocating pyrophosphatase [Pirellulales bacterium]
MLDHRRPLAWLAVLSALLILVFAVGNGLVAAAEDTPAAPAATADAPALDAEASPDAGASPTDAAAGIALIHLIYWIIPFVGSIVALVFAYIFFKGMMATDEGNEEMIEIAQHVRVGANAYLWQQYKIVFCFFVVIFILLAYLAFGLHVQNVMVPFAFLTGGFFSGLAGWCGMKTATWASSRTAAGAQKSLNQGLQVAFRSGAVMGLTVVGLGLLDITLWFAALYWISPMLFDVEWSLVDITVTMLCFGMGASSQALFARVGGGIFTKAADVGADLVGKVEAGIPEDDKRNPATIADNVGDNVGDVAGMGADLYESYCGSILATAALGVAAFANGTLAEQVGRTAADMQIAALFLPMVMAGVGIVLSVFGIFMVRTEEQADQKTLLKALARGVNLSSLLIVAAAFGLTYLLLPIQFIMIAMSVVVGLVAGWLIGKWTEYSTSDEFNPTRKLADQALTGPATIIIGGIADGMKSVWFPVIVVSVAMVLAFGFAAGWEFNDVAHFALGLYGVGIAAVGMLSTLGITLATDAYGPIADNAGGNAEMAGLEPIVRQRTDALDSLGNTTAATGKGFAIGSAALTALALLAAYVEEVRMGFRHWGESAVEQSEPGWYKLNEQFTAYVSSGEKKDREGNPIHEVQGYLIMPEDIRDPQAEQVWDKLKTEAGPVRAELAITGDATAARLKVTDAPLIRVEDASMLDWMTYYRCDLMNPKVLVGVFLGAMATFVFCSMTMKAVGRAAFGMVEEVRRQFREKPGIMDYSEKPDYATPVAISTKAAQREMIIPSLLGLATPVAAGLVLGVAGVMGLLVGALTCGFCVAVFMANAGGAWDNAKKYIEAGAHGGKGTDAHKAAVVGDTVGDPFKDTSGPSLNILIKLMSMVSVVAAGLIVRYSLTALGVF